MAIPMIEPAIPMIEWYHIILRLSVAMLIGCAIGFERELHYKSIGIRTLGLVSLGSALAVLAVVKNSNDIGRVIQGVITGVGFLGTGVILHGRNGAPVHGLTTAATIWISASVGALCALGEWLILFVGCVLTFLLLEVGVRVEKWLERRSPDANSGQG